VPELSQSSLFYDEIYLLQLCLHPDPLVTDSVFPRDTIIRLWNWNLWCAVAAHHKKWRRSIIIYDFLVPIGPSLCNSLALSCTVFEIKRDIGRNVLFFHTLCIRYPVRGPRPNVTIAFGTKKTRMARLPDTGKI